jgi:hypothetical protein
MNRKWISFLADPLMNPLEVSMLSVVKLLDVKGQPAVKLDLPQLKIGDPVGLRFRVERQNGGRTEELPVDGQFRVIAVGTDASSGPPRQLLSVEAAGAVPTWRSIKKRAQGPRRLPPATFPRTPV